MSIRLMTIVWDIPWPSQSALLIALKLADYANDEGGSIHPARDSLAQHAQTSLATVKRILAGFRDVGLLEVLEEGGRGPRSTTKYAFNLPMLMRLHDGYDEIQRDENAAEKFVIVVKNPVDACGEDEAHHEPLKSLRGSPAKLRGSPGKISGSIDEPRNTTLEPPSRTLSADSNFGLEKCRVWPSIEITSTDVCWPNWIAHLQSIGQGELAEQATSAGRMSVPARYPKPDTPLPAVPKLATLTERSRAMAGEGV